MDRGPPPSVSYRDAGVDIDRGDALVERIRGYAAATRRPGVRGGLGGFGALFSLDGMGYKRPLLVSSTDGVGTKLKLAIALGRYDTIGIDLVAMCVNDVLVQGAEPLFFLDYFATGRLQLETAEQVIAGIACACTLAGAALIGGETAEMPGLYRPGDFDLAGFCVGAVEEDGLIDGHDIRPGDAIIGIASSGAHANGYSLIRKLLERSGADLGSAFHGRSLGEALLEPTRIYVRAVLRLLREVPIPGLAHITGGGLLENLPRVMPAGLQAAIDPRSWVRPAIFDWIEATGHLERRELYRTFNCGVGMVVFLRPEHVAGAIALLEDQGEVAWVIGEVGPAADPEDRVLIA